MMPDKGAHQFGDKSQMQIEVIAPTAQTRVIVASCRAEQVDRLSVDDNPQTGRIWSKEIPSDGLISDPLGRLVPFGGHAPLFVKVLQKGRKDRSEHVQDKRTARFKKTNKWLRGERGDWQWDWVDDQEHRYHTDPKLSPFVAQHCGVFACSRVRILSEHGIGHLMMVEVAGVLAQHLLSRTACHRAHVSH